MPGIAGPPAPGVYAPFTNLTDFIVGPHCQFVRNGIVFNDRSLLEGYFVDEPTGFDTPARNVSSMQNVQQHGSLPETSFYGERTMTLTGYVQAGSYPQVMRMVKRLQTSLVSLIEMPMTITTKDGAFNQPDAWIAAKPSDVNISTKLEAGDITGLFKRPFTIAFRAGDPTFKEFDVKTATLIPTTVNARGRIYDKTYDYQYNIPMDTLQNPVASSGNNIIISSTGNWLAQPTIKFTGPMGQSSLYNAETDQYIFVDSLADGESVSMNVYTGEILDQNGDNAANKIDTASDWMWFNGIYDDHDGTSNISLFTDSFGAGAKVEFSFVNTHI